MGLFATLATALCDVLIHVFQRETVYLKHRVNLNYNQSMAMLGARNIVSYCNGSKGFGHICILSRYQKDFLSIVLHVQSCVHQNRTYLIALGQI